MVYHIPICSLIKKLLLKLLHRTYFCLAISFQIYCFVKSFVGRVAWKFNRRLVILATMEVTNSILRWCDWCQPPRVQQSRGDEHASKVSGPYYIVHQGDFHVDFCAIHNHSAKPGLRTDSRPSDSHCFMGHFTDKLPSPRKATLVVAG